VDVQPFPYTSDAPVDPHTEALLATFSPVSVEVPAQNSTHMVLRSWAALASRSEDRLVIVDSRFRCERNALATLLDDPRVCDAVLLAHNDAAGVNSAVRVNPEGYVSESGMPTPTAGVLVVSSEHLPAFTDGLYRAAAAAARQPETVHPWDVALAVLGSITPVQAIPADPFCASRVAMNLPRHSEDERRLRAAGSPEDTWITTALVRPITRRATKIAHTRSWQPRTLTISGLVAALLVPLLLTTLSNRVGWLLAAVGITGSAVAFLTAAQLVRYRRRPSTDGAYLYRQTHRWADVLILVGVGSAAAAQSANGWLWAGFTLATTALAAAVTLTTRTAGSTPYRQWWVLRWLTTAGLLLVVGPVAALIGAAAIAVIGATATVVEHLRDHESPLSPVDRAHRFLVAPGALLDAGVVVRALSNTQWRMPQVHPTVLTAAALTTVIVGAAASWGRAGWIFLVTTVIGVTLLALVLTRPLQGRAAWAMPAVVAAAEFVVLLTAASALTANGQASAVAVMGAIILVNGVVADRWHLQRLAPQPWLPVADLGFDGRMVVVTAVTVLAQSVAAGALFALALWLVLLWAMAAVASRRKMVHRGSQPLTSHTDPREHPHPTPRVTS
jgi:hypothetical protein